MIKLDERYYIDIDKFQYILKRREIIGKGNRKGEEIFYDEGYYGYDLKRLLTKYCHLKLRDNFPEDIHKLVAATKKLESKIDSVGNIIKKELRRNNEIQS